MVDDDAKDKKISTQLPTNDTSKTSQNSASNTIDDPLAPSTYKAKQQNVRNSWAYTRLKRDYGREMMYLLQKKGKIDLFTECNTECDPECTVHNILMDCEPLKRIDLVLSTYYALMRVEELCGKVPIAPLLTIDHRYGHLQMFNDFLHIKLFHIEAQHGRDEKKSIAKKVCHAFETRYTCDDIDMCYAFKRHYRDRTDVHNERQLFYIAADEDTKQLTDTEWIFQAEFDKIHCYFLHSTIQFCDHDAHDEAKANRAIDQIISGGSGRSWSSKTSQKCKTRGYVGMKEDKQWFNQFNEGMSPDEGYKRLIERMGIFR
eukprot:966609_1